MKYPKNNQKRVQAGFTLIEIISVLIILGVLAATAIPKYFELQENAERKTALAAIAEAQSRIYMSFSQWILSGKSCADFEKASISTSGNRNDTYIQIGDGEWVTDTNNPDGKTGGWRISIPKKYKKNGYYDIEYMVPIGKTDTPENRLTCKDSDPDKKLFRLYYPTCAN